MAKMKDKKAVATPPPPRNCLYLTYDERRTGGEICAGEEDSSWPMHEDEDIEWSLTGCYKTTNERRWLSESVDIDFDAPVGSTVYVVYVRYSTGGTFGRTNGAWNIIGVYDNVDQADKMVKSIEDDTYTGYKCWKGYFESFERADYESMVVKP